jgi:hypothetical protein
MNDKPIQRQAEDEAVQSGVNFLRALFFETDTILIRPIETWMENNLKKSKVDYKNTLYIRGQSQRFRDILQQKLEQSTSQKTNLLIGVCPRFGNRGQFDLDWQIRKVRVLWTDIDHVTVEVALERVRRAGLPDPSIVVNSGNGAHLYWLLALAYEIDDVGDPPPVFTQWVQDKAGRKKPRKYILDGDDRAYLDSQRHLKRLSPKAQHVQDLLAGIAKAVGSNQTNYLSHLLRIPGSLSRNNERNGQEPVPTQLVTCDPKRTYELTMFEKWKVQATETVRAKKIDTMPLPKVRKASASKADNLAQLIAASSIAETGSRSEADFAVCCFAIRNGIAKDDVWSQVETVGKFAEQGRRYFDLTWENAEYNTREATFDKLQKRAAFQAASVPSSITGESGDGRTTIFVDTATMPVGLTLRQVTDRLRATGNCFRRADQLVAIHDNQISPVLSPPEMAGLLNQLVEFYFVDGEAGEYKPFPPQYANTWLNHHAERSRLPVITLFTHNPVYTDDWRLVSPGFDAESGIFYAGPRVEPRSGTDRLDALFKDFCFKSPADRTNYLGVLLTAMLIPRFIGSKPAALFNGNQPELGKSILAQIIAILRDGQQAETASYNPNDEEFEKRLGAIVRSGATTIIIDNAKSRGRNPRIESACLERSITDPILSYRLLGESASIRAENSHIFCITANTPDVSRDLVTRSVVINLYYEGDPERRDFSIADPEGYAHEHRLELLGELIGMVELWKASGMPMANAHSRFNKRGWGKIVGGILEACGEPDFLANSGEAAALLDQTRREFEELVSVLVEHPQGIWTAAELVELCGKHGLMAADLGEGSPRSLATKMGTLAGRFVGERFPLSEGHEATFHRSDGRKGSVYQVLVKERSAEP